jgi:hypothetical protein
MLTRALRGRRGGVYWYVLQTHDAAEVAFNRFWDIVRGSQVLQGKPDESQRFVKLCNGATVFFKSGQNFEDLRVETLDGTVIDEYRQQDPSLWSKVIRPMLARRHGWAVILSTPNGYEHFYDLFEAAKLNPDEWDTFHAPSTEAPWWTPEEVASAKTTMTEDEFAQEILAEFREFGVGKVYKNHGLWNHREDNPFAIRGQLWSPYLPIVVGLDFNVGLMVWELMQTRNHESFTGDEIAVPNTNTQECAPILLDRVKNHKAGVILVGDASGKSKRSSATENDYQIIMDVLRTGLVKGVTLRNLTPEANPPIRTRVNIANAMLKDAAGHTHAWYNPKKCQKLKGDFERVVWKAGSGELDFDKSDPMRTHAADAWGYPTVHYGNVYKPRAGRMTVLMR